jgi:two-component system, NarL family, sensor histidine kinase DesK
VLSRWRGRSERSQVERVERYTWQSLYGGMLVTALAVFGGFAANTDGDPVTVVAGAGGTLALYLAGCLLIRDVARLYPARTPIPWRSLALVGAMTIATGAAAVAVGGDGGTGMALVAAFTLAWSAGGLRDRRVAGVVLVIATVLPALPDRSVPGTAYGVFMGALFIFTARISLWLLEIVRELERARVAQSALAVAEERLRFSRDLHDVLGRRLSTIAVQAELASALADRGDPAAGKRMLEVRTVAHEALREARELARGYRATNLPQELEGARSLLESAGIGCQTEISTVPDEWQEPAAWVVRETVTNALRHSQASEVVIRFDGRVLRVRNDGVAGAAPGEGAGLVGLRERLAPLGAGMQVSSDGDHFEVAVDFPAVPGAGPAARGATGRNAAARRTT